MHQSLQRTYFRSWKLNILIASITFGLVYFGPEVEAERHPGKPKNCLQIRKQHSFSVREGLRWQPSPNEIDMYSIDDDMTGVSE